MPLGTRPAIRLLAATGAVALAAAVAGCSSGDSGTSGAPGGPRGAASPTTTTPGTGPESTGPSTTATDRPVFPGTEWDATSPAAAGMDPTALGAIADRAHDAGSNCLAVTRKGEMVAEWYFDGTDPDAAQEVFSASKSFTSTLVGIAQADGDLAITDPAWRFLPQWKRTPSEAVTVRNLLSNDSGRHYDFQTDYVEMAAKAPDKTAFAIGLDQEAPPGTVWRYNNSAIQTLDGVLRAATGTPVSQFAEDRLFGPIGMADSSMKQDRAGNTLTFMGVQSTCRDMARYGYLMLRNGNWDGTQVVPAAWVAEATAPSQQLNGNYGYLWWLNRAGDNAAAAQATGQLDRNGGSNGGQMAPGAPDDMYFALGLGGQVIAIDPGSETVVVRLGPVGTPGAPGFGAKDAAAVVTQALVAP